MVIIISKTKKLFNLPFEFKHINNEVRIINEYQLEFEDQLIVFDYLLTDSLDLIKDINNLKILIDEQPVVNFFQQTSQEHIYVGDLEIALDHLINGE